MEDEKKYIVTTTDGPFLAYRVIEDNELEDSDDYFGIEQEDEDYEGDISEQFYDARNNELICALHPGIQHTCVDIKEVTNISLKIARRIFKESGSNLEIYKEKTKQYCKTRN